MDKHKTSEWQRKYKRYSKLTREHVELFDKANRSRGSDAYRAKLWAKLRVINEEVNKLAGELYPDGPYGPAGLRQKAHYHASIMSKLGSDKQSILQARAARGLKPAGTGMSRKHGGHAPPSTLTQESINRRRR